MDNANISVIKIPVPGNIRPNSCVIFMHGAGGNGGDIYHIAKDWQKKVPHAEFILPTAPFPSYPYPDGRRWFPQEDLDNPELLKEIYDVSPYVDSIINYVIHEYQLDPADIVLSGISQGAILSIHNGIRQRRKLGGILAISGMMPWHDNMADEILLDQSPPILFIHGAKDTVIPASKAQQAVEILQKANADVSLTVFPDMGHETAGHAVDLGGEFLRTVLTGRRPAR